MCRCEPSQRKLSGKDELTVATMYISDHLHIPGPVLTAREEQKPYWCLQSTPELLKYCDKGHVYVKEKILESLHVS